MRHDTPSYVSDWMVLRRSRVLNHALVCGWIGLVSGLLGDVVITDSWWNIAAVDFEIRHDFTWLVANGYQDEAKELVAWMQGEIEKREHRREAAE